jgi:hypothetical protein
MVALTATILDEEVPRARVAVLLKQFSQLGDDREPWRVMYPLKEVLLLIVCATIASCDDFEDICAWGRQHLDFLRSFSEFHYGIPCERWMRKLVNRVDPVLFGRCFPKLGGGAVAGPARPHRHRRQDRTAHPRSPQGAQSFAYAQRLRDLGAADPGAAQRAGKDQRDHRHPGHSRWNSPRPSNSKARW